MDNKWKNVESSVLSKSCESARVKMCSNETRAENAKVRDEHESVKYHDDSVAADWIKREHNIYETEDFYIEEELEISPTVLQPGYPVVVMPKMEPISPKRELSVEEPTPGCSSSTSEGKCGTGLLTSIQPIVSDGNVSCLQISKKPVDTRQQPHICTICDARFTRPNHLKSHMCIHTGERPFSCSICDAKFIHSSSLKVYMLKHTGERPFSCTLCDATFTQSNYIKKHMRVHTGERPFGCETCHAKFAQLDTLKVHMYQHTGERPFSCTLCDKKIIKPSNLKCHMRIHTGARPYSCTHCDAEFMESGHLKRHILHTFTFIQTVEPRISCNFKFTSPRTNERQLGVAKSIF